MKDIYDLIDEIEVSDEEMTEMEVSEFEKEKIKRNLKKSINKKSRKKKGLIAAGICAFTIGGLGILGSVNPAYASQIPFLGDIFKYIDNEKTGAYDKYKENANEINVTKESNGVSVTIKDAVFDGNSITYTYEIKSDKDMGDSAHIDESNYLLRCNKENWLGASCRYKKVSDGVMVGKVTARINDDGASDKANLKIVIDKIVGWKGPEGNTEKIEIEGNWVFSLSLDAVGLTEKSIDKMTEKGGVRVTVKTIDITPMSFTIKYKQELSDELSKEMNSELEGLSDEEVYEKMEQDAQKSFKQNVFLKVKDNLGNEYTSNGNGTGGGDDTYTDWVDTFNELDENATELIITPYNSEITFDDIVVDLAQ